MTDLLTPATRPTPADLIRDSVALMRRQWRVRGDFVIGRYTPTFGVCPVAALSVIAGDVFIRDVPLGRVPLVQETLAWLVRYHRLPRCRREREKRRTMPNLACMRVAEWADSFPESADDELYALMEAAADAWLPSSYSVGATASKRRSA